MMRVKYSWIAAVLALAAAGCGGEGGGGPVEPEPQEELHVTRFTYSGAASGKFEVHGPGKIPTDFTNDFATMGTGNANGVLIPFAPLAVNAGSAHTAGGFDMLTFFLNPSITAPGHYTSANCPAVQDFTGCIEGEISFGIPSGGGASEFLLEPVQDAVTLTIHKIVQDTLRASFEGTFRLARSGQPYEYVQVTDGAMFIVRNGS